MLLIVLIWNYFTNSLSISSNVFPLVSGNFLKIKKNPRMQIPAYTQKVPAAPNDLLSNGKVYVRMKQAIHKANVANAIAAPRIRFGNISDNITQVMGASDMA